MTRSASWGFQAISPSGDVLLTMPTRHDAVGLVAILCRDLEETGAVEPVRVAGQDLPTLGATQRQEAV